MEANNFPFFSKKAPIKYLALLSTILGTVIFGSWPSPGQAAASFLLDENWNNGKAAFDIYEASLVKYAKPREAKVKMISVKENFDRGKLVKTNKKENVMDVIKFHIIQQIPVGIYDYFQSCSIFFERQSGKIIKIAIGSLDGCGTTYIECLFHKDKMSVVSHSYMDDQGDESLQLDYHGEFFYDALPFILRAHLKNNYTFHTQVIPSLINNKRIPLTPVDAEITVSSQKELNIAGTKYALIYEARVLSEMGTDIFLFEPSYPHRLIKWEKNNGDRLILKKGHSIDYWHYTDPDDRPLQQLNQ